MKPHKWAKEIKAWADGAEIEYNLCKKKFKQDTDWAVMPDSEYGCIKMFDDPDLLFRISHRPKEPIINIDELGRNYTRALHDSLIKHKQNLEIEIANIIHEALNEIKPQPKEPQYLYIFKHRS